MSFIKKAVAALSKASQPEIRKVYFDSDWADSMESLKIELAGKGHDKVVRVEIPDALCEEIKLALENHEASPRIPYSEAKIPVNNVGESYRQIELKEFCEGKSGEEMDWVYGFLVPEILNPYDKFAVGIYAFRDISPGKVTEEKFEVVQVGYLDKETAKKVHKKVLNFLGKDQYIPLLVRMTGGSKEKPNYGAFPYVMSDAIKF